jgi:hypothetical protein
LLFADAVEILSGTDKQAAISDSYRRLNSRLVNFGLENNFEFATTCREHYDFTGLVDAVEFSVCSGE